MKLCRFEAGLRAEGQSRGPAQRGCDPAGTHVAAMVVGSTVKEAAL